MSPTATILALWLGFAGSHILLSSLRVRPRLVVRLGEGGFRLLYSVIAFAFFIPLVWVYFANKHSGPWLWSLPQTTLLRWTVYGGMGLALVLAAGSFIRPSPAAIVPGPSQPRGVQRITRHPLMMGVALFGLVHLLPNGSSADVAYWGGMVLYPLIGSAHQDRRKLAMGAPGFREYYEATPFFPFAGRSTLQGLRELFPAAAVGLGLTVVLRYFHASWFGG